MGMHHGFIVIGKPWTTAQPILEQRIGGLEDQGDISESDWYLFPKGVDAFHVTSAGGNTYMLDGSMVLSAMADFVVATSGELGCAVASAGAETVSGTYWLFVARNGELARLHWNCRADMTQPLDLGETLAGERTVRLEDVDGKGLVEAVASVGFDMSPLMSPVAGRNYLWAGTTLPAPGALQERINAHHDAYKRHLADDWTKHIKSVPRGAGGFDLQFVPPEDRPTIWKRLTRK